MEGVTRSVGLALVLLVSAAAVVGCSKPAPPKFTPERASLSGVSGDGVDLRVELSAENPNSVDLSAQSVTVKLSCDGREAGSTTIDHPVSLPAGQATKLDVPLHVKWAAASTLATLAATGRDVPYAVDGTVGLGGDLVHVEVPFHMTGTVSKDDLLKAALRSLPQVPGLQIPGLELPH